MPANADIDTLATIPLLRGRCTPTGNDRSPQAYGDALPCADTLDVANMHGRRAP